MELTMLEFAEALLKEIRRLQQDAESLVLNGSISDMERYRFLMGRLEGLRFAEQAVKDLLSKNKEDF
jgi:hypothetical protein